MLVLTAVAAVVLASTTTANATLDNATPEKTATVAQNSQLMACEKKYNVKTLLSPKGQDISVERWWKCDGEGSYDGKFRWVARESVKVWAEMHVDWHSGKQQKKKMIFAKKYVFIGADAVHMRACDSSGCGGWW